MPDTAILLALGKIVLAAVATALVARLLRAPAIVAFIIAGLLLGPATGLLEASASVHVIAETGIVLLLFLVGLELSLDKIRDVGRVALIAGLGQVGFTAAGGFALSFLLGFSAIESIFIATALTFSSTVVVVKVLRQKSELDTLYGRIAVGIFLVQDLVVIVVLTVLSGLGRPEDLSVPGLARSLGLAFGGMASLLAVALLSSRHLLPRVFAWMSVSAEGTFIWSLGWCFLFVVAAQYAGLSVEIGAFLAGISLAQLPQSTDLRRRVDPLMTFFVMVFFVALAVEMELGAATTQWKAVTVLSLFVLVGNPLIFMWIIARMGYSERTAFLTSVTVAQISEFSFVFAAVGLSAGLIGPAILSVIGAVGLITITLSVYMILHNHWLHDFVKGRGWLRIFNARTEPEATAADVAPRDHVIVVGMNALGRRIVRDLLAEGEAVVAVDSDARKLAQVPCRTVLGSADLPSVLEEAGLERARLLVSALQIEDANTLLAYRCRQAGVASSIHAFDPAAIDELREIGADHLIVSKGAGTRRMATLFRDMGVVGG
ncbi:MAG TPA: cation:proton antiporter family protein [Longimicrobiales bacterium]|nr:cation:proton antiporter family protein [Longimicrobiales bacterium]